MVAPTSRSLVRVKPVLLASERPASPPDFRRNTRVRQLRNKRMAQPGNVLLLVERPSPWRVMTCPTIPAFATIARNCADKALPPLRGWQPREGNTGALPIPRGLRLNQLSRSPLSSESPAYPSSWSPTKKPVLQVHAFPSQDITSPSLNPDVAPSRTAPYQSPCAFSRNLETSSAVNGSRSARSSSRLRRGSTAETGSAAR